MRNNNKNKWGIPLLALVIGVFAGYLLGINRDNAQQFLGQRDQGRQVSPTPRTGPQPGIGGSAEELSLLERIKRTNDLSTFSQLVENAGINTTLQGPGPFTVFAPTNSAFNRLPSEGVVALMQPESRREAGMVVTYHIVPGRVTLNDLQDGQTLQTLFGEPLRVSRSGNTVRLNGMAVVEESNIESNNGLLHKIDTVLLPPLEQVSPSPATQ